MLHKSIDWLTIDWQFSTLIFVFYCITSLVLSCVLSTHNKGILYCTVFQYITASICGRIYARVYLSVYSPRRYCIVFCTACTMSLQRKFMFAISSPDEFCVCRFAALRYGNAIILLQTLINLGLLRATLLPVVPVNDRHSSAILFIVARSLFGLGSLDRLTTGVLTTASLATSSEFQWHYIELIADGRYVGPFVSTTLIRPTVSVVQRTAMLQLVTLLTGKQ